MPMTPLTQQCSQGVRPFVLGAVLAALALFGVSVPPARANPPLPVRPIVNPTVSNALMQFTSQGHLLGFSESEFYVSNATYALRVEFLGAHQVAPTGDTPPMPGEHGAPPLRRVTYSNLWDGTTLVYDATRGILSSSYRLEPQADPGDIQLRYNVPVALNPDGSLTIVFATGQMTESAPQAWQEVEGTRVPVRVAFELRGEREVGFAVGEYDTMQSLLIDPMLVWTTFLGASGHDAVYGIAVDGNGNAYVAGISAGGWGSPVNPSLYGWDGFVAKLNPSGNLVWNTFAGGAGTDTIYAIAVDGSGNVYLAGESDVSWGFPVRPFDDTSPGPVDGFAAKLNTNGGLLWNTFLGGPGFDLALDVAVDAYGNLYVSGVSTATWESPKRTFTPGAEDAYAAKLNPNGGLVWNTFLGGTGRDEGYGIAVDSSGNVIVTGQSEASWELPKRGFTGGWDAFAAKLDGNGVFMWNTFLGGSAHDYSETVKVDAAQNVYVGGSSNGAWGTPVRSFSGGWDAFAAKLSSSGVLEWNSFIGGSGEDIGHIALDGAGNVHVGGSSTATWGSPVQPYAGDYDAFASKLSSTGALVWNMFLGGNGADCGRGIAVGLNGIVYIGGHRTPTPGSSSCGGAGGTEIFAAKIDTAFPYYVPLMKK